MANSMAALCFLAVVMTLVAVPAHAQCGTALLQAVADNPNLSELAKLITASNLTTKLNETDNVTVLAPNNEAFNGTNGFYAFLEQNRVTIGEVTGQTSNSDNRAGSIILYHILQGPPLTTALLTDGQRYLTSLTGYNLTADKTTTSVTFIGNANDATVVTADVSVCNSVVHVVNSVLLPSSDLTAIPVYYYNTPTPGVGENGASGLSIGAWAVALSGALAAALMM